MDTIRFGQSRHKFKILGNSRSGLFILFWTVVYGITILQDYIESALQSTGFYWSETMLYNTYWLWFIPLIFITEKSYSIIKPKSIFPRLFYSVLSGLILTAIHILLFTQAFVLVSEILYVIPHRFSRISQSVLSNHAYITLLAYTFIPIMLNRIKVSLDKKSTKTSDFVSLIKVRKGKRIIPIKVENIKSITTNKPYSEICANGERYLHNDSLKTLASLLDPKIFIRVHRSALVNVNHIVELASRGNGDYDARLSNGCTVRFSRHFREHWSSLAPTGA